MIFIQTYGRDEQEDDENLLKGNTAQDLFESKLKFDEVEMYCNLSKQKIIEKFESLEKRSNDFSVCRKENEILVIAIVSVGRAFSPETNET